MKIAAVILAGGQGSRIGGNKPLKILGGRRLIDRAEGFGRQWSDVLSIAVRHAEQVGATTLPCILDQAGVEGPLAGLAAALHFGEAVKSEAVLTFPVDMPFLPADLCQRLSCELEATCAAIASSGGQLHPVCGLWRVAAREQLSDYVASGQRSLKAFANAISYSMVDWPVDPVDPFFNINSKQDLATAERLLNTGRLPHY